MDKPVPDFTMGQIAWLTGQTPNAKWIRGFINEAAKSGHKTTQEMMDEIRELTSPRSRNG